MLNIVTLGDPILKKHSTLVTSINEDVERFLNEMFDTMYMGKGIGLAAVQVGKLDRIFVTHVPRDMPRVFINPEIVETSLDEEIYEEGCLSIPGINADVIRPYAIKVQAWNERGKPFTMDAEGLLARVIQHELDHLNGILFIDKLDDKKRNRLLKNYERKAKAG